jgi:hypothetical protein
LGADPFLADVGVYAPVAAAQSNLFADGSTDGASFQQVSNHVPGVISPSFKDFPFFPNLFEFVVAEHNLLPPIKRRTALTHTQLSGLENSDNGPMVELK